MVVPGALVRHCTIPFKTAGFECRENMRSGAGLFAGRVDIVNAHEPAALPMAGIKVAREPRDDRSEM
jgi:hypothetical protein